MVGEVEVVGVLAEGVAKEWLERIARAPKWHFAGSRIRSRSLRLPRNVFSPRQVGVHPRHAAGARLADGQRHEAARVEERRAQFCLVTDWAVVHLQNLIAALQADALGRRAGGHGR